MSPFATRLRALRKASGQSQVEAADALGISRSYLAGIETGHEMPGRETLQALAVFYGVTLDHLYSALPTSSRPQAGEFIEDRNELALVRFWRGLTREERLTAMKLLRLPVAADKTH